MDFALRLYTGASAWLTTLGHDDEGGDFVEYAVITGTLLALVAAAVVAFGSKLAELWHHMTSLL